MKKRLLLLALALSILGAVATAIIFFPTQPRYRGMKLSQALDIVFPASATSDQQRAEATEVIQHMGADALPWLIEWFDCKGGRFEHWFSARVYPTVVGFHVVRWVPWRPSVDRNVKAIQGFKALGRAANPAIPHLLSFIQRSSNQNQAWRGVRALSAIGTKEALEALMSLEGSRPYFRRDALLSNFISFNPELPAYVWKKYETENPRPGNAVPKRLRFAGPGRATSA